MRAEAPIDVLDALHAHHVRADAKDHRRRASSISRFICADGRSDPGIDRPGDDRVADVEFDDALDRGYRATL